MEVDGPRSDSPKRRLPRLEEISAPKRQKISYKREHVLLYKAQVVAREEPALVEPEAADKLLIDAIKDVLEEDGLKQGIHDPQIESLALEAFRSAVEECKGRTYEHRLSLTILDIMNICSKVRRSMLIARRTTPIPTDFESAIHALDIPRPDDQLRPYRTKPAVNPPLLPTPPPDDAFHNRTGLSASFLGPELNGQNALKRFSMTTSSLPPLPSAHTYKDTAVFPQRETDTRRIRELATEEGKLGEQALRRLAGAVKLDAAHPLEVEHKKEKEIPPPPRRDDGDATLVRMRKSSLKIRCGSCSKRSRKGSSLVRL